VARPETGLQWRQEIVGPKIVDELGGNDTFEEL
jgi:hypothetical protein